MNQRILFLSRFIALCLIPALGFPSPVFALKVEALPEGTGLEELTRAIVSRLPSSSLIISGAPPTGLEEEGIKTLLLVTNNKGLAGVFQKAAADFGIREVTVIGTWMTAWRTLGKISGGSSVAMVVDIGSVADSLDYLVAGAGRRPVLMGVFSSKKMTDKEKARLRSLPLGKVTAYVEEPLTGSNSEQFTKLLSLLNEQLQWNYLLSRIQSEKRSEAIKGLILREMEEGRDWGSALKGLVLDPSLWKQFEMRQQRGILQGLTRRALSQRKRGTPVTAEYEFFKQVAVNGNYLLPVREEAFKGLEISSFGDEGLTREVVQIADQLYDESLDRTNSEAGEIFRRTLRWNIAYLGTPAAEVWLSSHGGVPQEAKKRSDSTAGLEERAQVLEGHQGPVRGVAFSPDGKILASAREDGTIRLWDLSPPTPVKVDVDADAAAAQSAGLEELSVEALAEEARAKGFGFVNGRDSREYPSDTSPESLADFVRRDLLPYGLTPKFDMQDFNDWLNFDALRLVRQRDPQAVLGVALYSAVQADKLLNDVPGGNLILSALVSTIEGVIRSVEQAKRGDKVLVIAKVQDWDQVVEADQAGARGIEVEPAAKTPENLKETLALLVRIAEARRNGLLKNILVWGSASGITQENSAQLASKGYIAFSVGPRSFPVKGTWVPSARAADPSLHWERRVDAVRELSRLAREQGSQEAVSALGRVLLQSSSPEEDRLRGGYRVRSAAAAALASKGSAEALAILREFPIEKEQFPEISKAVQRALERAASSATNPSSPSEAGLEERAADERPDRRGLSLGEQAAWNEVERQLNFYERVRRSAMHSFSPDPEISLPALRGTWEAVLDKDPERSLEELKRVQEGVKVVVQEWEYWPEWESRLLTPLDNARGDLRRLLPGSSSSAGLEEKEEAQPEQGLDPEEFRMQLLKLKWYREIEEWLWELQGKKQEPFQILKELEVSRESRASIGSDHWRSLFHWLAREYAPLVAKTNPVQRQELYRFFRVVATSDERKLWSVKTWSLNGMQMLSAYPRGVWDRKEEEEEILAIAGQLWEMSSWVMGNGDAFAGNQRAALRARKEIIGIVRRLRIPAAREWRERHSSGLEEKNIQLPEDTGESAGLEEGRSFPAIFLPAAPSLNAAGISQEEMAWEAATAPEA